MPETLTETRPLEAPEEQGVPAGAQPQGAEQGGFGVPTDPAAEQAPDDAAGGNGPEAPGTQTQQETAAEQRDAQVRLSDEYMLGNRRAAQLKIHGAGNRAVKAWQGMKAKVRNAFDTPGKAVRRFALDRAKKSYDRKEKRVQFATSERAKRYHEKKLDRAADKLNKREVSHDDRAKRMEARTQAVHESAERRRQNYIDTLKAKKEDAMGKKALRKQLREDGEGWIARRKITAEVLGDLTPAQRRQLGDVAMKYAAHQRYEKAGQREYNRADRSRQRTARNVERTNERMGSASRERQEASEAAAATRELLSQAQMRTAELQTRLEAEEPDTPRYNVMAAALREAQEQVAAHEASVAQYMHRAQESQQSEVDSRVRSFDLNAQYTERDARATAAHEDSRVRRSASRQHKAALDQEVSVALNPSRR